MAGPMSCEQREESRHTDWLYFFLFFLYFFLNVVPPSLWFDAEQYKMSHAWIFHPGGRVIFFYPHPDRSWAGWPRKADSIFILGPPLVTRPFSPIQTLLFFGLRPLFLLRRLWSPSNGMIVVADVRHLS